MISRSERWRLRRLTLWARLRRLLGFGSCPSPAASPPPPDEEAALVSLGPPRRPRPSGAVALELPPERDDLDLYGYDAG